MQRRGTADPRRPDTNGPPWGGGCASGSRARRFGRRIWWGQGLRKSRRGNPTRGEKGSLGWLDNAARQSRLNRLRRASYKLPLQVPAAKIVIDDPVEHGYQPPAQRLAAWLAGYVPANGPAVRWGQAPRVGICPPLWVGQPPAAPRSFRQLPVQTGG